MGGQLFAGAGLGLLVGILVGLSASPVVSVILGSIAAGLVTLLGFVSKEDTAAGQGSVVRLGSFGVACAIAVVVGIFVRTHNVASPSISQQVEEIRKAGYSAEEARRWVAYRNLGANLDAGPPGEKPRETVSVAPAASSVLFSGTESGDCRHFDTTQYKNAAEQINALRLAGGRYAEYADKIASMDANQQKTALDGLRLLFCPL